MSVFMAISAAMYIVMQPILGAVVDRLNKVKVLYSLDYASGVTDLALAALLFTTDNPTLILIGLFINGIINATMMAMYQPTYQSMVPLMLKEEELNPAYSFMSTLGNFQNILGVLFAAICYVTFGFKWLLIFNGITFIIAAFLEMFIKIEYTPKVSEGGFNKLMSEVKEGYSYMHKKKELINMAKVAVVMNFFLVGVFGITMPYMINNDLGLPPYILAGVSVAMSVGGIVMSLKIANQQVTNAGDRIYYGFLWGWFCLVVVLFDYHLFSTQVIPLLAFIGILFASLILFGASSSYIQIPLNTSYAKRVDKEMMARVMALRHALSSVATPLAMIIYGFVIDGFGVLAALSIGVIGIGVATLYSKFNTHIRSLNDTPEVSLEKSTHNKVLSR
jgi:MFS family permease